MKKHRSIFTLIILLIVSIMLLMPLFACGSTDSDFTIPGDDTGDSGDGQGGSSEPQAQGSFKILAIGNSFSIDAVEYLYQLAKLAGFDDVVIGNLYIGGCSLQTHANNIAGNSKKYRYFKADSTTGGITERGTSETVFKAVSDVINEEEWEYVSLQQCSDYSGVASEYEPYLTNVMNYVKSMLPQAKLLWHMTWAYPHNSAHSAYKTYYGQNQTTMYNSIVAAVQNVIVPKGFYKVLPVGTAIQNARTSFIGDNLSRDELHLTVDAGRAIAGLTWLKAITGVNLNTIKYENVSSVITDQKTFNVAIESVNNAVMTPYAVTQSAYPFDAQVKSSEITALLSANGYNADDYYLANPCFTYNAFWNSCETNYNGNIPSTIRSVHTTGVQQEIFNKFICTGKFKRAELPYGTLIVNLADTAQYRPDGWVDTSISTAASARPNNVSTSLVKVDKAWWGDFTVRAFNISRIDGENLTNAEMYALTQKFAILVPKNPEVEDDSAVVLNVNVINGGQTLNDGWTFADHYQTGSHSAITVNSSVTYNFTYNNINLNSGGNYYRNFYLIFGPINENNDGATVIWDGVAKKEGQFMLDFMVNFEAEGLCRIFVRPIDPSKGIGANNYYEGYEWAPVGQCNSGGSIKFNVKISDSSVKLSVNGTESLINLTGFFNGVNGQSYKNSSNNTNIAVKTGADILGTLKFLGYTAE